MPIRHKHQNNLHEQVDNAVKQHIHDGLFILKRFVYNADDATLDIWFPFILSTAPLATPKYIGEVHRMSHLAAMMEQVKKLKNGMGVQRLLDEAYQILGNPIAMNNTEYTLQAYTEVETDDPIWNELIELGTFGKVTQRFFEQAGFIEEVANNRIAYLKTEHLKYDRINGKLFSKSNTHISNLIIVACNKPFEEGDQMVFEIICKLVSKEISENADISKYEQEHQEMLIKNLIDGNYDKQMDVAQVEILYGTLDQNLYLIVVDVSLCNTENANPADLIDLLKQVKPEYKYAVYSGYVVIIISTDEEALNVSKELKELMKIFEQSNLYAGISNGFENLFELKKHYMEAIQSLEYVIKCKCSQRIFPYHADSLDRMKQIEALENGLGIQYFLDIAPKIFGNPVLFHDMEINLLAYSKNVEINDPVLQELITYGTSSYETTELFRTTGMIDIMDNTKGGALLVSDQFKYDRISWRVYNSDNIRIGCTSIAYSDKPYSEDDLVLFGVFSQKFSNEVGKIEFYNNYGQVYSNTIISRLISGKIDDHTFYTEDISNLYDNLMDNLYLMVVDTTQCESEHGSLSYIKRQFSWPDTVSRYAIYSIYIVIIISINDPLFSENAQLHEIIKVFEQNNVYAGISSRFDDIYDLPKYYTEAVGALRARINEKRQ